MSARNQTTLSDSQALKALLRRHRLPGQTPAGAAPTRRDRGRTGGGQGQGGNPEERLPKDGLLGKATLTTPSGTAYEVDIYVNDGVPFLADFNVLGEMTATPLERIKIERRPNKRGFRWYGVYRVPPTGDTVRIRLDRLPTDVSNREENLRPFPPGDPNYKRLYGRRPDTESINSLLVRCSGQWGRAHSYGWRRQFLDLVGFALLINAGAAASFERRVAAGRPPDAATP